MFDLFNLNIGGSGFGGDRTLAGASLSSKVTGISRAPLPRAAASAWAKIAKKFIAIFDTAAFDPYTLAKDIWDNSNDAEKRNIFALQDALMERVLANYDSGDIFTTTEQEIANDINLVREAVRNAGGY